VRDYESIYWLADDRRSAEALIEVRDGFQLELNPLHVPYGTSTRSEVGQAQKRTEGRIDALPDSRVCSYVAVPVDLNSTAWQVRAVATLKVLSRRVAPEQGCSIIGDVADKPELGLTTAIEASQMEA